MLWPFSRKKMILPSTHPEHLPVVLSDMRSREENFQGYVCAVGDDKEYTVLLHQGMPVQHLINFGNGSQIEGPELNIDIYLKEIGESCTMLVMELDQVLAATLATIFSRRADLSGVICTGCFERMLEQAMSATDFFVVNSIVDGVSMPAIFEKGQLVQWFRFSPEQQTFESVSDEKLLLASCSAVAPGSRADFYLDPTPIEHAIEFKREDDPFFVTVNSYFSVFEQIRIIMVREQRDRAAGEMLDLLKAMRDKYPPLYQGIFLNPETLEVNWERMLDNRLKISHKFRYDPFFVYLDELLLMLIRKFYGMMGVRGIVELIRFVEQKRRADLRRFYHLLNGFNNKLASLLHMDRVNV